MNKSILRIAALSAVFGLGCADGDQFNIATYQTFTDFSQNGYQFQQTDVIAPPGTDMSQCYGGYISSKPVSCYLPLQCQSRDNCSPVVQITLHELDSSGMAIGTYTFQTVYGYDKYRDQAYIKSFNVKLDSTSNTIINTIRKLKSQYYFTASSEVVINSN